MNILAISTLFPSPTMPNHGIFVKNRLIAMKKSLGDSGCIKVVNPIPTSPLHSFFDRYKAQQNTPLESEDETLGKIIHPRYISIPKYFKDKEHLGFIRCIEPLLEQQHQEHPFTHIDAHWTYPELPLAIKLSKKWGIPCSVTLRGMEAFYVDDNDNRTRLIAESLKDVDKVISLSGEMSGYANLIANTGERTDIITNGADTNKFTFLLSKNEARKALSLNEYNSLLLLGVGSLIERKGFQHVISTLPALAHRNPGKNIVYYIIGSKGLEGDFEASLKEMAKNIEQQGPGRIKIIFKDQIPNHELPLWYNAADVFCLSSYGEGSPNVLTEALSSGCPAVATNVGAVYDIMNRTESTGIVIPPLQKQTDSDKKSSLCDAIQKCLSTDMQTTREKRAHEMSMYSWDWCGESALKSIRGFK